MDQTSRIFPVLPLRLRVTRPQPCAYLTGQQEQRLAGDISARPEEHDSLAEAGFRRVENWPITSCRIVRRVSLSGWLHRILPCLVITNGCCHIMPI